MPVEKDRPAFDSALIATGAECDQRLFNLDIDFVYFLTTRFLISPALKAKLE